MSSKFSLPLTFNYTPFEQYFPKHSGRGRKRKWELRLVVNTILYVVYTGCQWRMLPHDFTPWPSVYNHFNKWCKDGSWFLIHQSLHQQTRIQAGRHPEPSVALIDSQSVKTTELSQSRGFDGGKKVKGQKRLIAVDTLGIPMVVKVHDANLYDGQQAYQVLETSFFWFFSIRILWADAAYRGQLAD